MASPIPEEAQIRISFWESIYKRAVSAGHNDPHSVAEKAMHDREQCVAAESIRAALEGKKTMQMHTHEADAKKQADHYLLVGDKQAAVDRIYKTWCISRTVANEFVGDRILTGFWPPISVSWALR